METKPLFRDINADDPEVTEVESLCMSCQETGVTRILLTRIPFYKEVVLMSFSCEHCGYENNEIQSGAPVSDKGVRITLNVKSEKDLNRQVVKSDFASMKIVDVDFEIPAKSQKGEITTIEGIIDRSIAALEQDQPVRKIDHPETASQIDEFIQKLKGLKEMKTPFTMVLEDISGNSFVQNPDSPKNDENCKTVHFVRSKEQDHELGFFVEEEITGKQRKMDGSLLHPIAEGEFPLENFEGEVLHFSTNCHGCGSPGQTNMKLTKIPHFKEVVIMATNCDICGIKTNEIKSGGGIEPKGVRIEVDIRTKEDFTRDVLKSETCDMKIPQLELEVGPHAVASRFTTVEGLIAAVKEQLSDPQHSHFYGDSAEKNSKQKFEIFLKKFDDILEGVLPITLVLDDPAGNSYVQTLRDDDQPDEGLRIIHYERSYDQNDELGLNDMKTENYETS